MDKTLNNFLCPPPYLSVNKEQAGNVLSKSLIIVISVSLSNCSFSKFSNKSFWLSYFFISANICHIWLLKLSGIPLRVLSFNFFLFLVLYLFKFSNIYLHFSVLAFMVNNSSFDKELLFDNSFWPSLFLIIKPNSSVSTIFSGLFLKFIFSASIKFSFVTFSFLWIDPINSFSISLDISISFALFFWSSFKLSIFSCILLSFLFSFDNSESELLLSVFLFCIILLFCWLFSSS